MHGLYGYINYFSKQSPPQPDSDLETLLKWSDLTIDPPYIDAVSATGTATFTGTDTTLIPAGTEIINLSGITYITNANANIAGTTVNVAITAVDPGSAGNAEAGTTFTLVNPISGINSQGTYIASGGGDAETREQLYNRMQRQLSTPPRAGGIGDYENWALEASTEVAKAWEFPGEPEVGYITIVIATADLGTPSGGLITIVQNYIDLKRPILMAVPITGSPAIVRAPNYQTLNLTIQDALASQHNAIEAGILGYLRAKAIPGAIVQMILLENVAQEFDEDATITSPATSADPGAYGLYNALNITWTGSV
jgi:uncharacterized phage protein gp47/JayE